MAKRLLNSLVDGGWLLLGSADPLLTELSGCTVEVTPAGLVYQRGRRAPPPRPRASENLCASGGTGAGERRTLR